MRASGWGRRDPATGSTRAVEEHDPAERTCSRDRWPCPANRRSSARACSQVGYRGSVFDDPNTSGSLSARAGRIPGNGSAPCSARRRGQPQNVVGRGPGKRQTAECGGHSGLAGSVRTDESNGDVVDGRSRWRAAPKGSRADAAEDPSRARRGTSPRRNRRPGGPRAPDVRAGAVHPDRRLVRVPGTDSRKTIAETRDDRAAVGRRRFCLVDRDT